MRKTNTLKASLKEGQVAIGTWSIIPSPSAVNVMAAAGLDFIIIDMEHGPTGFETAEDLIRAVESEGSSPVIRVPSLDEAMILRALDIGAHGVIVPHVETPEDAAEVVKYAKYKPEGERGFSPYTRAGGYSKFNIKEHCQIENGATMVIVVVEGVDGIRNLDRIIEVPGLDVIYLGIYDLSQAIGRPGEIEHPEVKAYVEECVSKVRERGLSCGCFAHDLADIQWLSDIGIQFITYMIDTTLLFHAYYDMIAEAKRTLS